MMFSLLRLWTMIQKKSLEFSASEVPRIKSPSFKVHRIESHWLPITTPISNLHGSCHTALDSAHSFKLKCQEKKSATPNFNVHHLCCIQSLWLPCSSEIRLAGVVSHWIPFIPPPFIVRCNLIAAQRNHWRCIWVEETLIQIKMKLKDSNCWMWILKWYSRPRFFWVHIELKIAYLTQS